MPPEKRTTITGTNNSEHHDVGKAFAKFQENRFKIDGEIAENHAILVNFTASIVCI